MTGSVQNVGEGAVEGVGVTIELVGEGGKTVASSFGQLSADALAPGEKATFTAQLDTEATAQNVRVLPRWRSRKEGDKTDPASPAGKAAAAKEATPPVEPTPRPLASPGAPPGAPAPRSPDMPAPPANAPGRRAEPAGRRATCPSRPPTSRSRRAAA